MWILQDLHNKQMALAALLEHSGILKEQYGQNENRTNKKTVNIERQIDY